MTLEAGYVLALLLVALVLFATEWMRVDVAALLLLLALTLPRVLTPGEALAGFGSETIIVLISLFVMTEGVIRTGVVERIGLRLASLGSMHPLWFVRFLLIACTAISAFISNTVTAAVFLPVMIGGARRAKIPASKVLMPMAFASILSSGVTVISTSTNLVVSGLMPKYGLEPLGFFELAPVGLVVTAVGMLFLIFVAPRLVPDRAAEGAGGPAAARRYVSELVVTGQPSSAGKTVDQLHLGDVLDLIVVGIRRGTKRLLHPWPSAHLRAGDEIVVEGKAEAILSAKDVAGIAIKSDDVQVDQTDGKAAVAKAETEPAEAHPEKRMVEAMVLPRSPLVGRTLRQAHFREATDLSVLAIHTAGEDENVINLSRWRMKPSDVLLLQGEQTDLDRLDPHELMLLDDVSAHHPRSGKGRTASAIFVLAIFLGATRLVPLPIAFLAGVVAMVLTRCLSEGEAYAAIEWRLMVLIGAMMAFGAAMEQTGAARWLAGHVVASVGPYGGYAVMCAFGVLTIALTQPMSNQAAALVVLPVAVEAAGQLGLDTRTMVIAVTMAASLSFLTPLEPACLLVYGPGRYRFFDFVRVGFPLTLISFAISMAMIPLVWPLLSR
jgi:di/tricarboxylate transporter